MDNCIVTRAFRGASLFLVALHNGNGYQWSADRAQALRMPSGAALDVARAASGFDPNESPAVALDPLGQLIEPARAFTGHDGKPYSVGDRVEIHPGTDQWMRGARFGTVTGSSLTPNDRVRVKLDKVRGIVAGTEDTFRKV